MRAAKRPLSGGTDPRVLKYVRKNTKKLRLTSSCPSERMEHLGSRWTDFHEIWYLTILRQNIKQI